MKRHRWTIAGETFKRSAERVVERCDCGAKRSRSCGEYVYLKAGQAAMGYYLDSNWSTVRPPCWRSSSGEGSK